MNDIENRDDLETLLSKFYTTLLCDNSINYFFTDIAKINLKSHLPKIIDFWNLSLFGKGDYSNNVMKIHLDLNEKEKFTEKHFNSWLNTFYETVDANFCGKNSEIIKTKAYQLPQLCRLKCIKHCNTLFISNKKKKY